VPLKNDASRAPPCTRFAGNQFAVSNRTAAQFTDSSLLRHYLADGNEAAFSELVHRYQHLVLGAALRRSGDLELARDVAQQVFAALARKANLLAGRESLAGWLHQATMYETTRAMQSEFRRRARHELLIADEPQPTLGSSGDASAWAALDEEVDRLPFADREVIAMHYFQDLSYEEMAAILGLNEVAVRKRVSRALQRLGEGLKERGVSQTAAALLAGALAIQNSVGVPVGLAQAALALVASGGGNSAFLTLTAIMSRGLIKTAAVIVSATAIYFTWPTNGSDRSRNSPAPPPVLVANAGNSNGSAPLPSRLADPAQAIGNMAFANANPAGTVAGIPRNSGAIATVSQAAGSKDPPEIGQRGTLPQTPTLPRPTDAAGVNNRVTLDTPATVASSSTPDLMAGLDVPTTGLSLDPEASLGDLSDLAGAATGNLADLLEDVPILPGLLRQLELVPAEAADFYTTLLNRAIDLTPVEELRVRQVLETHFLDRALAGLAGSRPLSISSTEWSEGRAAMLADVVQQVSEAVPIANAVPQVVESVLSLGDSDSDDPLSALPEVLNSTLTLSSDISPATSDPIEILPNASGSLPDVISDVTRPVPVVSDVVEGLIPGKR